MVRRYKPKAITTAFEETSVEGDRAAAIVATSNLEYALECLIESSLRQPKNAAESGVLFSDNGGIFGTLSQKINGAYFTGLIGPVVKRDCHLIREIRNEFSHNMNPVKFETSNISNKCNELGLLKLLIKEKKMHTTTKVQTPRNLFLGTAIFLSEQIYVQSLFRTEMSKEIEAIRQAFAKPHETSFTYL